MTNYDQTRQTLIENVVNALKGDDERQVQQALLAFAGDIAQGVLCDAKQLAGEKDATVLAARGVRQLTSKERAWYRALTEAMKDANPRQALTNITVAMPETILDTVMDDIQQQFPLLNAISFVNTTAVTKWIYNKQGVQTAVWGALGSGITKELSGAFGSMDMTLCKLSAYFPVPKDFLNLGPEWLDRYVRAVLMEANALALEMSIVDGTGKNEYIGMTRDVSDDVSVTAGVYPRKTAVTLASFGPADYLTVIEGLTKTPTGRSRAVSSVGLIVNPTDYFKVVRPATTILNTTGQYVSDVFPFPTTVYQSSAIEAGKAVLGLLPRYLAGLGAGIGASGMIEYDDSVKFLDDVRVYATRLYGNGRALDDNAFVLLDISGVQPVYPAVTIKGTVNTKAVTTGGGTGA